MKFLKDIVSKATDAVSSARSIHKQFTEVAFLEAAVSVGFLIGGADGDFDADERAAMINLIKSDPTLSSFDDDQITTTFNKINDLYAITLPMGNRKALEIISKVSDPEQRRALMEIGAVLSTIDGSINDTELAVLDKIAVSLNESVSDYKDLLEV